jgi:acyl carrier protein
MRDQIISKVKTIVEKEADIKLTEKDLDASLQNDLRLDSVVRMKIIAGIEKEFDIIIDEIEAVDLSTINELIENIEDKVAY